jgi:hypothetical protein
MHVSAAIFIAATATATAAHSQERALVVGVGVSSCGEFTGLYRQNPTLWRGIYFAWTQGFMSGVNVARIEANSGPVKGFLVRR